MKSSNKIREVSNVSIIIKNQVGSIVIVKIEKGKLKK